MPRVPKRKMSSASVSQDPLGLFKEPEMSHTPIVKMSSSPEPEVFKESEPSLWQPPLVTNRPLTPPPSQAIKTSDTPESSTTESVSIRRNPSRSTKRKRVLEESIHFTPAERTAACGMDEEEGEAALEDPGQLAHVKKWISELPLPSTSETIPPSQRLKFDTTDIEHSNFQTDGSEFDSDFDDEFDVDELIDTAGMARSIPDDAELDDRVRNVVQSVERAMDEAVDNLDGISPDFHWQANFDTFRGVPETFSGPTPGAIKDYDTPYDAFKDIWSRDIMEHICKETNRYAKQVVDAKTAAGTLKAASRLHRWVDTDVDELYLLFAIYIFMGIDPRTAQHEYWKTNSYLEMPKFRQLMTFNRFILLSKFLHFSDNSDLTQDLPLSGGVPLPAKLRKLAPVISHLNSKFESLYNLNQDIAIDESLTLYKGKLSWVQAIKSKAARFGIKSFELCESKTGYMYRFDIYTGKNSERGDVVAPSVDLAGKSTQVVLDLLKGLERRGYCVTMDNYYNCPSLARYLKTLGFDCLGTLRPNRKHVPLEIANVPKNVAKGTIVSRHSGDVSCIAWKDTKVVTMISTYHTDETYAVRKTGRELVKPVVVRDYNNTMGGVDLKDQKLSMYLLERKRCLKWYMKMFKRLLNVSVHNALILLLSSLGRRDLPLVTHRKFREQLAAHLVMVHRPPLRDYVVSVAEDTRLRKDIMHVPEHLANKRMRCHICFRNGKNKMVRLKCETCDEAMCFGDCWKVWHSAVKLPGRTIHIRKGRRDR